MKLKYELFLNAVLEGMRAKINSYAHSNNLDEIGIDVNEIANTTAIKALSEIQEVIQDDENISDFDAVEAIVCIFEKYNIDAIPRHDF